MPSIDSIVFCHTNWVLAERKDNTIVWLNDPVQPSAVMSLHYFPLPPDIAAPLSDIKTVRNQYREMINAHGGGLLLADSETIYGDLQILKVIFKIPQRPHGMSYLGSITIPFADFSYVIKVQAEEIGTTGVRDAIMLVKLEEEVGSKEEVWNNWTRDPYEPDGNFPAMPNQSEREEYDSLFPNHPLSIVRRTLDMAIASISLDREIYELTKFTGKKGGGIISFLKPSKSKAVGEEYSSLDPEESISRSEILIAEGKGSEAIACLRNAIERFPDDAHLHETLGKIYLLFNHLEHAIYEFSQAIKAAPENIELHALRASAFAHLGMGKEGLDDANKALSGELADPAGAHITRAICLIALNKGTDSVIAAEKALEIVTEERTVGFLAQVLMQVGNLERTVELCSEFLEKNQSAPSILHLRATAHRAMGNEEMAQNDLDELKKLYESDQGV